MDTGTPILFGLSDGYRSSRRLLMVLAAVATAWATTQIEIGSIKSDFVGEVDLRQATVPALLLVGLLYLLARSCLEFAMQAVEIRRWGYARLDVQLSIWAWRGAVFALGASGLERSPRAIGMVIILAVVSCVVAALGMFLLLLLAIPILHAWRTKKARRESAIAATVGEALFLAIALGVSALAATPLVISIALQSSATVGHIAGVAPTISGSMLFSVCCLAVLLSFVFKGEWERRLFAIPPAATTERAADGRLQVTFRTRPSETWEWSSRPRATPAARRLRRSR